MIQHDRAVTELIDQSTLALDGYPEELVTMNVCGGGCDALAYDISAIFSTCVSKPGLDNKSAHAKAMALSWSLTCLAC